MPQNQRLVVLGSGQVPPNPSELLGSPGMQALLRELEQRFDHVLIDAPPLLPVTDAAVLSQVADGVIVVVGMGSPDQKALARSLTSLESVGARVLGVVLNRMPTKGSNAYYAYHQYGYAPETVPGPLVKRELSGGTRRVRAD